MTLAFLRPGGGVVQFDESALQQLHRYRQVRLRQTEAGGVLLGRLLMNSRDIVIDRITTPAWCDGRSRFGFLRSERAHQKQIDRAWEESAGRCLYLGEWHSHPEDVPRPSEIDLLDWKRRLREDQVDLEAVLFVIIGLNRIRTWEGSKKTSRITLLKEAS